MCSFSAGLLMTWHGKYDSEFKFKVVRKSATFELIYVNAFSKRV